MIFRYLFVLSLISVFVTGCAANRPTSPVLQAECPGADCAALATAASWPKGAAGDYALNVQPFVKMMFVDVPVATTKLGDSTVLHFADKSRLLVTEMYRDDFPELIGTEIGMPDLMSRVFEENIHSHDSKSLQPEILHVVISLKQGFELGDAASITTASRASLRAYRLIRKQSDREKIVLTSAEHPEVAIVVELNGFTNAAAESILGSIQSH